jgi:hypothetical protein
MRARALSLLAVLIPLSAGCYHATITTGATPSAEKIEKHWASGWVFGLVPPSTVETAARCPSGVARIETQISFLNGLVSILTLSIYTPMDIVVTCAGSSGTALAPLATDGLDLASAIRVAAEEAASTQHPVFIATRR